MYQIDANMYYKHSYATIFKYEISNQNGCLLQNGTYLRARTTKFLHDLQLSQSYNMQPTLRHFNNFHRSNMFACLTIRKYVNVTCLRTEERWIVRVTKDATER